MTDADPRPTPTATPTPTPATPDAQLVYGRETRVPAWLRLVCLAGAIIAGMMGATDWLHLADRFIGLGTSITYGVGAP